MNDEEFTKFKKRYQGLMYLIAHRIGGDRITNDFDDSIQDLSISGMDATKRKQAEPLRISSVLLSLISMRKPYCGIRRTIQVIKL